MINDENLLKINEEDCSWDLFVYWNKFLTVDQWRIMKNIHKIYCETNDEKYPQDLLKMNDEDYPWDLLKMNDEDYSQD